MSIVDSLVKVPSPKEVRELLEELLGRDVQVAPGVPYAPSKMDPGTYAVYVDDKLVVRAVAVVDLALSAHAGSAIGLMPPAASAEAVKEIVLPQTMQENLYEVLNICAALLNDEGLPHMKLYAVHHIAGNPPPPNVPGLARVLGRRLDLMVKVNGYGNGRISFVVTA